MPILQAVPDLLQSLSSFVSMLGMHSIPYLLMFASCLITISTFLCRILLRLMNLSAVILQKVRKKLSRLPHSQPKAEQRLHQLEKELQALRAEYKYSEVRDNEQQRVFKIQR